MATAGLFSMDIKETGYTMVIPDDDLARLMYYLHCVTVGVGLDILQNDLVDFRNYNRLSEARIALVLKYAIEFSPDEFENKLIFRDDEGEVVTGASPNKFCTISTACDIVSVQRNIVIAGNVKDVTKVMFFKTSWLDLYYTGPITRAFLGTRHCIHCKGASGMCQCDSCPRPSDSGCQPFLDVLLDALNSTSLSSPPPQRAAPAAPPAPARTTTSHECICDGCRKKNPEGARYRCEDCEDVDLCQSCYSAQRHDLSHRFMQIERPGAKPFHLYPRSPKPGVPPPPINRPPSMNPLATPVKSLNSHACNCDGCGWQFIDGPRYKCEVCADYDLCKECYSAKRHNLSHRFMQIDRPGSTPIHLSSRALSVPAPAPAPPARSRSPVPPVQTRAPPRSPAPPARQPSPAPPSRTPSFAPPPPPNPNPPSYATAISHTATPDFYNTMKVSELKDFLKEHGVAYEDILDKETLCRRAWDAHCDSMSVSELNVYLANNNISTHDCRDIASRRDKVKRAFHSSPPPAPVSTPRKEDPPQIRDGDIVMLIGLSRAEMNGKNATVLQADCGGGRAEVDVQDLGRTFKVKLENLLPVSIENDDDFLD